MENGAETTGIDMVDDSWTKAEALRAVLGGPENWNITPEQLPEYLKSLHERDIIRTNRIRARVDKLVADRNVAENLKAWYWTWCKRPTFHDDYLLAFNRPNTQLVDTGGLGIQGFTENGIKANNQEIEADLVILSTGFEFPGTNCPTANARMTVIGRNGLNIEEKWAKGVATLHGVATHDFPNLFFVGLSQVGAGANYTNYLDTIARHVAGIIARVVEKATPNSKVVVEPMIDAEERWAGEIVKQGITNFALLGCTPSYYNAEGDADKMVAELPDEKKQILARAGTWTRGTIDYAQQLQEWKAGGMEGLDIQVGSYA